jgi:tetratricopeptide (TPR) repeat protein
MKTLPAFILAFLISTPHACAENIDDDLGFARGSRRMQTGAIFRQAFSVTDEDAIFIVNNTPLLYRRQSNRLELHWVEQRFDIALANARANAAVDWRSLATLLEGAACFYRKLNRNGDSIYVLAELVQLLKDRAPESSELCEAQIAFAKVLTAAHQYGHAESSLHDALRIAEKLSAGTSLKVAEIQSQLYFLYLDTGRADLAILSRRAALQAFPIDVVAIEDQKTHANASSSSWRHIINSIDAVATEQEVAEAERAADREALAQLRRNEPAVQPKSQPKKADKKEEKEEPPLPYRLHGGTNAH